MLRDHHSRIIVALQHQGIEQISKAEGFPFRHSQMHLGPGGGIGGGSHYILRIAILKSQYTGHDLRRTGHGPFLKPIFFI